MKYDIVCNATTTIFTLYTSSLSFFFLNKAPIELLAHSRNAVGTLLLVELSCVFLRQPRCVLYRVVLEIYKDDSISIVQSS